MVAITIWLPTDFPQGRPTLTVSPALAHHWVDREMRIIGHGSLAGWNPSFSLGKIIKDIEIEFNLRPPSIVTVPPTSVSTSPKNASIVDAEFPEVDSESLRQLNLLSTDSGEFEKFFLKTLAAKEALSVEKELSSGNLSLAKKNLAKKKEIASIKEQLHELQKELASAREILESTKQDKRDVISRFSLETVIERIKDGAEREAEAAELSIEDFVSQQGESVAFAARYKAHRKKYHLHLMKAEKLEQMHQQ